MYFNLGTVIITNTQESYNIKISTVSCFVTILASYWDKFNPHYILDIQITYYYEFWSQVKLCFNMVFIFESSSISGSENSLIGMNKL